jgi:uncharacterized membrane protein
MRCIVRTGISPALNTQFPAAKIFDRQRRCRCLRLRKERVTWIMISTMFDRHANLASPSKPKVNVFNLLRSSETHKRSIAKAISWRVTGSLDTFVLAALIIGDAKLAVGVALAETLTKTALYYVHERAWASFSWGRRR